MTLPTLIILLDPNGLWRRHRFEFCNALEDLAQGKASARSELEKLGVTVKENGAPPPEQETR